MSEVVGFIQVFAKSCRAASGRMRPFVRSLSTFCQDTRAAATLINTGCKSVPVSCGTITVHFSNVCRASSAASNRRVRVGPSASNACPFW